MSNSKFIFLIIVSSFRLKLNLSKLREKYSKRANEFAIDKFNTAKVVGETLKIYKEMLNEQ